MIRRPPSSPLFPSTTLSRSLPLDLGVRVAQPVGPAEPRARPGRDDAGPRAQVRVPSSEDGVELRATRPVHEHAVLDLVDVDFRPDCAELLLEQASVLPAWGAGGGGGCGAARRVLAPECRPG